MARKAASPSEVRAWLLENGHHPAAKGRLSPAMEKIFTKATRRPIARDPRAASAKP